MVKPRTDFPPLAPRPAGSESPAVRSAMKRFEAAWRIKKLEVAIQAFMKATAYHHSYCASLDYPKGKPCNCSLGKARTLATEALAGKDAE